MLFEKIKEYDIKNDKAEINTYNINFVLIKLWFSVFAGEHYFVPLSLLRLVEAKIVQQECCR